MFSIEVSNKRINLNSHDSYGPFYYQFIKKQTMHQSIDLFYQNYNYNFDKTKKSKKDT